MMKKIIFIFTSVCTLLFTGCGKGYDNFDEPKSSLTGTVKYNDEAVGVRTNGQTIELWQDGFGKSSAIYVQIAQDGTYSASLFDGTYKMVVKSGSTAPWVDTSSDTTEVIVKGNTSYDVDVTPYFTISNTSISNTSTTVTFTFTVNQIVSTASFSKVRVYLNDNVLTDNNYRSTYESIYATDGLVVGESFTYTLDIPEDLQGKDYIFARIGVLSDQASEYYYSQVEQIDL